MDFKVDNVLNTIVRMYRTGVSFFRKYRMDTKEIKVQIMNKQPAGKCQPINPLNRANSFSIYFAKKLFAK